MGRQYPCRVPWGGTGTVGEKSFLCRVVAFPSFGSGSKIRGCSEKCTLFSLHLITTSRPAISTGTPYSQSRHVQKIDDCHCYLLCDLKGFSHCCRCERRVLIFLCEDNCKTRRQRQILRKERVNIKRIISGLCQHVFWNLSTSLLRLGESEELFEPCPGAADGGCWHV